MISKPSTSLISSSSHLDLSYNHKNTEILEAVKAIATAQSEFQLSVFQEIATIHDKLNTIMQKFDDCIEVEDRSVVEQPQEEAAPLNSYFESYEDDSEDQQEDDQVNLFITLSSVSFNNFNYFKYFSKKKKFRMKRKLTPQR